MFLLNQIAYRAAELDIRPVDQGAMRYIGRAWSRGKKAVNDKKKAEAATVADDGLIRSDEDNNESEDEDLVFDPNESEEHRAKRRRIYQEDRKIQRARGEEMLRRATARREWVAAMQASRDEEERQRNEAVRGRFRGNR